MGTLKNSLLIIILSSVLFSAVAFGAPAASLPLSSSTSNQNPTTGLWRFSDGSTVIELNVQNNEVCELSLTRFLGKTLKRLCRYEPNPMPVKALKPSEQSYLVFLHDEAGHCDAFADFEFNHDIHTGLLTFYVGQTPFAMQQAVIDS